MHSFPFGRLLVPLTFIGLVCLLGAEPAAPLRYDGKTFDEWRERVRTELKPELRAECIKAMIAFGLNERAEDAAKIIIDLAGQYDPDDEEAKPIRDAAERMVKLGRPAILLLLGALGSDKPGARALARAVLLQGYMPCSLSDVLAAEMPRLLRMAHSEDAQLVGDLLEIIRRIGKTGPDNANLILDLLGSRNPKVRVAALRMLDMEDNPKNPNGPQIEARKGIPPLIRLMEDDDEYVRLNAMFCLRIYGPEAKKAIPVLCKLLKGGKIKSTWEDNAYEFLGKMGPAAKEAVPLLKEKWVGCVEKNTTVVRALECALRQIDPKEATRILGPEKALSPYGWK